MNLQLKDKVALITGGASGIGQASALLLAKEGAKVVIVDVSEAESEATVQEIKNSGGEACFIKADVSNSKDVASLLQKTVETFGRLDIAHNNAGIEGKPSATHDCEEATWDQVLAINLKGVWLCMKHEIPQMLKQGGGVIVNTASSAGLVGLAGMSAYSASKHGVLGLTKTAALEYAKHNIRINAICPGFIETPMTERNQKDINEQLIPRVPNKRWGTPEEIAQAVVWLCSDAASFMVGHAMTVDGGWVAQ